MITNYCFAYETMFWQCSTENYMKSCFKAILLIITHTVRGICLSSRGETSRLNHNFLLIFLIAAQVDVMIQWQQCYDCWTIFSSIFKEADVFRL